MRTKDFALLLNTSDDLCMFRDLIFKANHDFDILEDSETLFHVLIRSKAISETLKNKYIFVLSDVGIDINHQNKFNKTCLHLAVSSGMISIINTLLQCSSDLTIVDNSGLCAYNYARRLQDKELSKRIIDIMKPYYPTYWVGVDNADMNIIRRLVNSWCKFKVKKAGKFLIDYAREKNFTSAVDLFSSLEPQMDLCFSVLACNVAKIKKLIEINKSQLLLNFKNMKENGSTVLSYAIKEKSYELLTLVLDYKPFILSEIELDEKGIDYPIYFTALREKIDLDSIKLLTPEKINKKQLDISCLFYKGQSVLRYSLEVNVNKNVLEEIMKAKYCSKELITVRDPNFLTCRDYALNNGLNEYVDLIDEITIDYILNYRRLRMQLALNGFDFSGLKKEGKDLESYARDKGLKEVKCFFENLNWYQEKINEFHKAVENDDYNSTKALIKIDFKSDEFKAEDIFIQNLIESKKKNESQTVIHKAVLNGYYNILEVCLETPLEVSTKCDRIRDHCQRTPMHYAHGFVNNARIIQLLSHMGFSTNVFDKDGNTPLDFQERNASKELQDLLSLHRKQSHEAEPNPWTWQVWTSVQREKNDFRQLISTSHPSLNGHGHSHNHGHSHGSSSHSHDVNGICSSKHDHDYCQIKGSKKMESNCSIS